MILKYNDGREETVETKSGKIVGATVAVIELAHRSRHWSHGVMSVEGQRGVAAEQVFKRISHESFSRLDPYALPVPFTPILTAIRELCKQPQSVAAMKFRGNPKRLQKAVDDIIWTDCEPPIVEANPATLDVWANVFSPRNKVLSPKFSAEEIEKLEEKMSESGYDTLSDYLRDLFGFAPVRAGAPIGNKNAKK